ncbi:hypothetical protein [Nonomuraea ceibae]|uniref:hypothetical protein n=1 Tax=Nonomuraea ceibae TaxID=1935170 RepID=UPI001C5F57FF|nr:hypothetical protein [Nonomuraea ceibae]
MGKQTNSPQDLPPFEPSVTDWGREPQPLRDLYDQLLPELHGRDQNLKGRR